MKISGHKTRKEEGFALVKTTREIFMATPSINTVPSCTVNYTHTHNRSEYAAITLTTFISTSTVEPYL